MVGAGLGRVFLGRHAGREHRDHLDVFLGLQLRIVDLGLERLGQVRDDAVLEVVADVVPRDIERATVAVLQDFVVVAELEEGARQIGAAADIDPARLQAGVPNRIDTRLAAQSGGLGVEIEKFGKPPTLAMRPFRILRRAEGLLLRFLAEPKKSHLEILLLPCRILRGFYLHSWRRQLFPTAQKQRK